MKSYELLREVFKIPLPKNVARGLKLSLSLIHQWSRQRDGKSEARNPLDCIVEIIRLTGDLRPLQWLCEQFDGYFVLNPKVKVSGREEFLAATGSVIQEMAHLQIALGEAVRTGRLTRKEAVAVRTFWEQLKPDMERYSLQCDKGDFAVGHHSLRTATFDTSPLVPLPVRGGEDGRKIKSASKQARV